MSTLIEIVNDGFDIKSTNYWDTEQAKRGFFFLSWNAGSARLLIPDSRQSELKEIMTAKYVVISRVKLQEYPGRQFYELLFEDHSDAPYVIRISVEQSDRLITRSDGGKSFFHAYTRNGLQITMQATYQ